MAAKPVVKALMLGSGYFPPERKIVPIGVDLSQDTVEWTTLDANTEVPADIRFDLNLISGGLQLPLEAEAFDEIHAYQVLEHFGKQGDHAGFFADFREFWRILKPGGLLVGDTPALTSPWLWGDPGHTRIISMQSLSFLTRRSYEELGKTTSTDYRQYVDPCWWLILCAENVAERFMFVLKKVE